MFCEKVDLTKFDNYFRQEFSSGCVFSAKLELFEFEYYLDKEISCWLCSKKYLNTFS